jgi:hypothetical protein
VGFWGFEGIWVIKCGGFGVWENFWGEVRNGAGLDSGKLVMRLFWKILVGVAVWAKKWLAQYFWDFCG